MSDEVTISNLQSALHALTTAPEVIGQEVHGIVEWAGNLAESAARAQAYKVPPTARQGAHLPKGRRVGMLAKAVSLKVAGEGLDTTATVRADGLGPVILHGAKAHEIPRPGGTPIHHPGIHPLGWSYIDEGMKESKPEIDRLMATTGERIVSTLAKAIGGGP